MYVFSLQDPYSNAAQIKYTTWRYEMPPAVIFNWKKDCWTAINIQDKASAPSSPSGDGTPASHDGKD